MLEGHLLQFGSAADIFNDATGAGEQFVKRDDLGGVDVAPIQLEAGRAVLVVERAQVADDEIAARRDRIDGRLIGTAKGIGQPLMKAPLGELVNSLLNLGYRVRDLVRHAVATGSIFVLAQQGRVGSLQFNQDELAYLRPRTHERIDALARPVERRARRGGFQLPTHWIKEDVVFDKESSRMYTRILGIAPLQTILNDDGSFRAVTPIFWVYYPDLRPMLAKFDVYNGRNFGAKMSWEELFESRMFASRIIKSTINNPNDFYISSYVKDPILALLEGENIKEKIFNYEQDLWSY